MASTETHTAVVVGSNDTPTVWPAAPRQPLQPNQFSIRTEAVGVNPSDTKMRGPFATAQGILGTDYAGTVVAVGTAVTDVAVGDRVAGAQNAMYAQTPERGAFRAVNVNDGKVWLKLPQGLSTEAGATFGAGISTAGLALKLLGLPLPDEPVEKPAQVLVYGGSTATGTMAVQLLKLANMIPIATCSPRNFELVQSYGVAKVFDYREKDCAQNIRDFTKNNLRYALDCISTAESTAFCFAAMGRGGGKYVSLDPIAPHAATRKMVKTDWVLGPSIFGEGSTWPAPYGRPPSEEMRAYGEKLWAVAQRLVDEGKLRHHPLRVLEGGWEKVLEGMELVKSGTLSGEKVVVKFVE